MALTPDKQKIIDQVNFKGGTSSFDRGTPGLYQNFAYQGKDYSVFIPESSRQGNPNAFNDAILGAIAGNPSPQGPQIGVPQGAPGEVARSITQSQPNATLAPTPSPEIVSTQQKVLQSYFKGVSTNIPSQVPTRNTPNVYQKLPNETDAQYYARLPGSAPGSQTTGVARSGIDVPAPTISTPTTRSEMTDLLRSIGYGERPTQNPEQLATAQLASFNQTAGVTGAQVDLTNAKNDLAAFEQTLLSTADKIKGQPVASTVIGRQLVKLDADTQEAYRQKQAVVAAAADRLQTASQQVSQLVSLSQFHAQEARQKYEFESNKAFQFLQLFQQQQNRVEDRQTQAAQAALTGFLNVAKDNPDILKNASSTDRAQWSAWEVSAGYPTGYTEGLLKAIGNNTGFEFKGTVGSAETGYSSILYNPRTGETKTVRLMGGSTDPTPSNFPIQPVPSFEDFIKTKEQELNASIKNIEQYRGEYNEKYKGLSQLDANKILSAVNNLRFSSVEESRRIRANITERLNQGDVQGAEEEIRMFGYQKLANAQRTDYDLYEGAMSAFQSALGQLQDPSLTAGPYKALFESSKPWLTLGKDKKYTDLRSIIELGQAQLRKGFYGTAVTGTEAANAKNFLITDNDDINVIKWKLESASKFLQFVNDATVARSVNLPKPDIKSYINNSVSSSNDAYLKSLGL